MYVPTSNLPPQHSTSPRPAMAQCPLSPTSLPGPSGAPGTGEREKPSTHEEVAGEEYPPQYTGEYGPPSSQLFPDSDSEDGLDVVFAPTHPSHPHVHSHPAPGQYHHPEGGGQAQYHHGQGEEEREGSGFYPAPHYRQCPYTPPPRIPPYRELPHYPPHSSYPGQYPGPGPYLPDPRDPYLPHYPALHRAPVLPPRRLRAAYTQYGEYGDLGMAGMEEVVARERREERQVLMRHASTSTPPLPPLRQNASTSTDIQRKRNAEEQPTAGPAKTPRVEHSVSLPPPLHSRPSPPPLIQNMVPVPATAPIPALALAPAPVPASAPTSAEAVDESPDLLLCTEALPTEEEPTAEIPPPATAEIPCPRTVEAGTEALTGEVPLVQAPSEVTSAPESPSSRDAATGASKEETSKSGRPETREGARVALAASEIEFVTSTLAPRSKPGSTSASRRTSPSQSRASPAPHLPAYSQAALRDLVCATLAPAAAANLIKSEKREKKEKEAPMPSSPAPGPSGLLTAPSSPQPGPSGTQHRSDLAAPDLQLDCLSSDTEESSSEDVQVVKISRRRKTNSSKPPVEVDLTQEMTSDDDEITVEEVRGRPDCQEQANAESEENKPEIAVANFASVQLGEQANIQSSSRGSTPGAGLLGAPATSQIQGGEGEGSGQYRVPADHSHYTRGREVGLLMEVPGVRRMEERGEERRRRGDERGEVGMRRRGMEEMLEMDGEEEARAGDHLEFRPRRLRHPWTEEVCFDFVERPHPIYIAARPTHKMASPSAAKSQKLQCCWS